MSFLRRPLLGDRIKKGPDTLSTLIRESWVHQRLFQSLLVFGKIMRAYFGVYIFSVYKIRHSLVLVFTVPLKGVIKRSKEGSGTRKIPPPSPHRKESTQCLFPCRRLSFPHLLLFHCMSVNLLLGAHPACNGHKLHIPHRDRQEISSLIG